MARRRRRRRASALALLLLLLAPPARGQESPKGYIEMPQATDGAWVLTSPPGSGHNWGTPAFVRYLVLVAREWKKRHPEGPVLRIGDMSKPDGADFPPHKTHKDGLTADIFTSPKNICHKDFADQDLTVELAKLMHDLGARQILFNGPKVIAAVPVAEKWPDHDDHFHVVIDPSRVPAEGELVVIPDPALGNGATVGGAFMKADGTGLELRWRVLGATKLKHWKVQLDDTDDANGLLHDPGTSRGADSKASVPLALEQGKEYRWRVEVTQADGKAIEVPWQRFKVDLVPPRVDALEPRDEVEVDGPPVLSWRFEKAGAAQAAWRIELDLDRNHKKPAAVLGPFSGAGARHAFGKDDPLRPSKKYFWRIVATDAHGNEGASEWRWFKTSAGYDKDAGPGEPKPLGSGGKERSGDSTPRGKVTATSLNLRAGPATDKPVLGQLTKGAEVKVLSQVPGWLEVEATIDGKTVSGFVSSEFIELPK